MVFRILIKNYKKHNKLSDFFFFFKFSGVIAKGEKNRFSKTLLYEVSSDPTLKFFSETKSQNGLVFWSHIKSYKNTINFWIFENTHSKTHSI